MTQCQTTCGRTNGCDERLKLFIVAEGQYRAADGSNGRRKGKPHPLLISLSHTKAVLKDGIHDPTNTKGGFYHRGYNVNHCVCVCVGGGGGGGWGVGNVCRCARFSQNCGECVGHS